MNKSRVAILTGGESSERRIALESTENIRSVLSTRYQVTVYDFPKQLPTFLAKRNAFIAAVPVFHGKGGEDGTVQGFLKTLGIPFIFSDVAANAVAMNKAFTKNIVSNVNILTAPYRLYSKTDKKLPQYHGACVIKPLDGGSSVGISLVRSKKDFLKGLKEACKYCSSVLIERLIPGKEFTVAVVETRGRTLALPVIEICPKTEFFNLESKYTPGLADEICPARVPIALSKKLQAAAVKVHAAVGARHLTRSDFIVDKDGRVWFLEINTIPGQTLNSLVPRAMKAAGIRIEDIFSEWINAVSRS